MALSPARGPQLDAETGGQVAAPLLGSRLEVGHVALSQPRSSGSNPGSPGPKHPFICAMVTTAKSKDKAATLLLAILLGLIGFYGMGHIYLGRVARGIFLLLGGLLLRIIGFVCYVIIFPVGSVLLLGSIALFIWQIFDASNLVDRYNKVVQETGSAPW